MSWNTCLFCYAQERGGTFFGLQQETNFGLQQEPYEGSLLLEDPKGQILISTKVTYSGRYGTNRDISVAVRAALERPYTLRVKKQSALQEGVNTVLDGLDLGARILGKKTDLSPDYGAPELADDRGAHRHTGGASGPVRPAPGVGEAEGVLPEQQLSQAAGCPGGAGQSRPGRGDRLAHAHEDAVTGRQALFQHPLQLPGKL